MRISTTLPDGFQRDLDAPPTAGRFDGCWIALLPPRVRESRDQWVQNLLASENLALATSKVVRTEDRVTRAGWPVTLRVVTLVSPTGALLEKRLIAIFKFLHLLGGIMIRAPHDHVLEGTWIHEMIENAQPIWPGDDVIAIVDLWR